MTEEELDLVETQDLINALYRRQGKEGCVLVVLSRDINDNQTVASCHYRGPWPYAFGLAEFAKEDLKAGTARSPDNGD